MDRSLHQWWNPNDINSTGIGGSETACINIAKQLAALRHGVRVFNDCPHMEGTFDNVKYIDFGAFEDIECNIFIYSRQHGAVERNIKARAKFLWVHDVTVGASSPKLHENLMRYDRVLCLSDWHKNFFLDTYKELPLHPDSVLVTRNGIDTNRFAKTATKKNKLVFPSSANRGLDNLLDYWPSIRARTPDAELHVYYGFETWEKMANMYNSQADLAEIHSFQESAVIHPRRYLAWSCQSAGACGRDARRRRSGPTRPPFTETSCITAMEAQAAGCVPVTTKLAALGERVKHGILLDSQPSDPNYRTQFVDIVTDLLHNDHTRRGKIAKAGREYAMSHCDWSLVAKEWDTLFRTVSEEVGNEPLLLRSRG